jgi:hypothetical protein
VMNMTPLALPGRWRTRTRPAAVTRLHGLAASDDPARSQVGRRAGASVGRARISFRERRLSAVGRLYVASDVFAGGVLATIA